jgi:hypothetical protein
MAKIQLCEFKRQRWDEWERGCAYLTGDFDMHDILFIVDENGRRLDQDDIDTYNLLISRLGSIDTKSSASKDV